MESSNPVEASVTSIASKGMTSGGVTSVLGWLTSNDTIAIMGVALTIFGFIVNLYFQVRRDRREQALHAAQLADITSRNES
jgi:hypothetical protein